MDPKRVGRVVYELLKVFRQLIADFGVLYDMFTECALRMSARLTSAVDLFGELLMLLPKDIMEEIRRLEAEEHAKHDLTANSVKDIIRRLLGDDAEGGTHPHA